MKIKLQRRPVSNEEFNAALADEDNRKIIKKVLSSFIKVIPPEELEICGNEALWRCLGYHEQGKGNKLTTSLWRFTKWECLRMLKKIRRENNKRMVNLSTIETKEKLEIPIIENQDYGHLHECISLLSPLDRQLIQEYFFDRRTMHEIGKLHGYSKEAARQKINKAVNRLRRHCLAGV
jgi:RNA polymerase sigma factor (sigma-70 family)